MSVDLDSQAVGLEPPERRAPRTPQHAESRLAFFLIVPSMIVLALIIGYPVIQAIVRSLFGDGIGETPFVGLQNYAAALWGDESEDFWASVNVTYFFTAVTVVLETIIGFAMALVMNEAFKGRSLMRASVLVPWAIPTAVTAVLWQWSFDPQGIINHLTGSEIIWTGSEWPAKFAIILADTWKTAPFMALLILAGLQIIPGELDEAAKLDGAGALKRFRNITLPLVKPALVVAILFRVLDALRMYDLPAIFTNGANDTATLSILVVRATLSELKPGYGGALSTLTFIFIFATAFALVKMLGANAVAFGREK